MKEVIFTMGLPGAGKSTVIKRIAPEMPIVDSDLIKKSHPEYDPKQPELIHDWSTVEAQKLMYRMLGGYESFVVDGTGTNIEKYLQWFSDAKSAGFEVRVVFVDVNIQTAIERNAKRERSVPVEVIVEKSKTMNAAFEFYSTIVKTEKIDNN